MWKKILFVGLAIILGVVMGIMSYWSGYLSNISDTALNAIEAKEYDNAARIFTLFFDYDPVTEGNVETDNSLLQIYPAIASKTIVDGDDEYSGLQYSYALYLYEIDNSKINFEDVKISDDVVSNESGFVFYNDKGTAATDDDVEYHHYFMNQDGYVQYNENESTYDLITQSENYQFLMIEFTEEELVALGNKVTKIALEDSEGIEVFSYDVALEMKEQFFTDVTPVVTDYNNYVLGDLSEDDFKENYSAFKETFPTLCTTYRIGYSDSQYTGGSLIWQTIGTLAIFAVVVVAFYFLLFKRSLFNSLRERRVLAQRQRNKVNDQNKKNAIDAKVTEKKTVDTQSKEENE